MRKAIMFVAALMLAGCAAQQRAQERQATWDSTIAELQRQNDEALAGRETWAAMYQRMNAFGYQQKNPIFQEAIVSGSAVMMPFARARDAGQISLSQLQDAQMYVGAQVTSWVHRQINDEEARISAEQSAESARLTNALAGVYMGAALANPRQYAAPPVNCSTNKVGNFYSTNCR